MTKDVCLLADPRVAHGDPAHDQVKLWEVKGILDSDCFSYIILSTVHLGG
jgi:hypothetical protein